MPWVNAKMEVIWGLSVGETKVAINQALEMSRKKLDRRWASLGLMGIEVSLLDWSK